MNLTLSWRSEAAALFLLCALSSGPARAQGQLLGSELLRTLTASELQAQLTAQGIPALFLTALYDIEVYRITYLTPYRHPDSLVQASGLVVVPLETDADLPCGLPLACYGHGTEAGAANVPSFNLNDAQALVVLAYASTGYLNIAPDYLGLGDYDERVLIHPYQHAFSQANTTINMIRAAREFMASRSESLSGQVYLYGYSQGGFTTTAALREIESRYAEEFDVIASAPMSGAYDMAGAQADLIALDVPYPTPGYLPYIILAYQDQYDGILFNNPEDIFVPPFDTLLPALFYGKATGIGTINELCTPVPKDMIQDSVIANFETDPEHRFRRLLAENEMLEWAPQSPVRILYCQGDDQVSYLNSLNAFARWNELGAPSVEIMDFGSYNHNDCALFCFLDAKNYFDSFDKCEVASGLEAAHARKAPQAYPNPASGRVQLSGLEPWLGEGLQLFDPAGRLVWQGLVSAPDMGLDLSGLAPGLYVLRAGNGGHAAALRLALE
jgi:hypothetical protein